VVDRVYAHTPQAPFPSPPTSILLVRTIDLARTGAEAREILLLPRLMYLHQEILVAGVEDVVFLVGQESIVALV
jgi:hypothetical protein